MSSSRQDVHSGKLHVCQWDGRSHDGDSGGGKRWDEMSGWKVRQREAGGGLRGEPLTFSEGSSDMARSGQ